jgi:DNA-binding response OmpR family regulator
MIKFLVVDDEKGISEQLKDFLEDRDFKTYAATDQRF